MQCWCTHIHVRWLYWADRTTNSIERVAITGAARETLYTRVTCAAPLTLDYSSHTVYWIDYCSYRIESLNMNGDSSTHSAPVNKTIVFPSGITQLEDMIYWTEPTQIFAVNKTRGEPVVRLYRGYSNNQLGGLEIVHTSKQPPSMFWLSKDITSTVWVLVGIQHSYIRFPALCLCTTMSDCWTDYHLSRLISSWRICETLFVSFGEHDMWTTLSEWSVCSPQLMCMQQWLDSLGLFSRYVTLHYTRCTIIMICY